jgi:hypothetical protein
MAADVATFSESTPAAIGIRGEMVRRQRAIAALPMRQLAAMSGISNPYLRIAASSNSQWLRTAGKRRK